MEYRGGVFRFEIALLGLAAATAFLIGAGHSSLGVPEPATAGPPIVDSDGDGLPDPSDAANPQPGEDQCPSLAEDPDGVADLDGCPDTDASVSVVKDEAYAATVSIPQTRTVDIWIQNGNYPADLLVHALSVSTIGACEVSLVPAPSDVGFSIATDEDGDTIADTFSDLLEGNLSLAAGETFHTTRDYEIICHTQGQHSFELQVDVVPLPPVEEEDVENLPNVHKNFPIVTVAPPSSSDSDGDGFSDSVESLLGTLPTAACAATAASQDEDPDPGPADFNDDQAVNITDVGQLLPPFFGSTTADATYSARRDLSPDGVINISDVGKVLPPVFGAVCS